MYLIGLSSFETVKVSEKHDFTGFWKSDCEDAFGLQIKPYIGELYSISFCGPGGCLEPGTYRPNTTIRGDAEYLVIDDNESRVRIKYGGWSKYTKCTSETNPVLRYK